MLQKMVRALFQHRARSVAVRAVGEDGAVPRGDALFRALMLQELGSEGAEILAELDYSARVQRRERLAEIRRRELAANAKLSRLSG